MIYLVDIVILLKCKGKEFISNHKRNHCFFFIINIIPMELPSYLKSVAVVLEVSCRRT